jgi:hypothetical protein
VVGRLKRRLRLLGWLMAGGLLSAACDGGAALPPVTTVELSDTTITTGTSVAPTTTASLESLVVQRESGKGYEHVRVSNPKGACIRIVDASDIVISDAEIGPCSGRAIEIIRSENILIEASSIFGSDGGVYALDSTGVMVKGSIFALTGRNPIQFDKVSGEGNGVIDNTITNDLGSPHTEDSISVYSSGGTEESPLLVAGNTILNGGSSPSGSGILVGDNGGQYLEVRDNLLVNPGQVGIGVAGGTDIRVLDNLVFSESHPWSNVGIYVWDQYDSECGRVEVSGNHVEWYNSSGVSHPRFDAGNCGRIIGWDDNNWTADLRSHLENLDESGGLTP